MIPIGILFSLFILFLALLFLFLFFDLITISFTKLGFPAWATFLLFLFCLIGSAINIPLWRETTTSPGGFFSRQNFLYFYPPTVSQRTIAVNVGGAIIPVIASFFILPKAPWLRTAIATAIIIGITYWVAQPVPGQGIRMPFFVAPLASVIVALILTGGKNAAAVAYISGVLGTLIGADLLHLSDLRSGGIQVLSIGGAGVFDGIFLTGIIAAFLA